MGNWSLCFSYVRYPFKIYYNRLCPHCRKMRVCVLEQEIPETTGEGLTWGLFPKETEWNKSNLSALVLLLWSLAGMFPVSENSLISWHSSGSHTSCYTILSSSNKLDLHVFCDICLEFSLMQAFTLAIYLSYFEFNYMLPYFKSYGIILGRGVCFVLFSSRTHGEVLNLIQNISSL